MKGELDATHLRRLVMVTLRQGEHFGVSALGGCAFGLRYALSVGVLASRVWPTRLSSGHGQGEGLREGITGFLFHTKAKCPDLSADCSDCRGPFSGFKRSQPAVLAETVSAVIRAWPQDQSGAISMDSRPRVGGSQHISQQGIYGSATCLALPLCQQPRRNMWPMRSPCEEL